MYVMMFKFPVSDFVSLFDCLIPDKDTNFRHSRSGVASRTQTSVGVESIFTIRSILTDVVLAVVLVHTAVLTGVTVRTLAPTGKRREN